MGDPGLQDSGHHQARECGRIQLKLCALVSYVDCKPGDRMMTVTGGRTVTELRGISCLPLELMEPTRKGIAITRSFGAPLAQVDHTLE